MSSVVHFKFNSSLKFDIVHFDGPEISLKELKAEIVEAKKLDKSMKEYDLLITNQNSKTEYKLGDFIPKNSSVIVSRIPISTHKKAPKNRPLPSPVKVVDNVSTLECISKMTEVASLDLSEEDKLATVMDQGNKEFDVLKQNKNLKPRGPLPKNYVCHRCHIPGHHIQDCTRPRDRNHGEPLIKLKKSSGIPRSFLTVVEDINTPGVLLTSSGELVVPKIEAETYGKRENTSTDKLHSPGLNGKAILPKELVCPVCDELQVNPVVLPCCSRSACDNCVITKLLQSNPKCPVCKMVGVLIANVKPNEELASLISSYKNDVIQSGEKKDVKEEGHGNAKDVPDFKNVKTEVFENKPKSDSSEISDSSEEGHEKKTQKLISEETAVPSSRTPPPLEDVSRIQTVPINTFANMTGVRNYPKYNLPLNYPICQNGPMVQQAMNVMPFYIYSDTGVPYIYPFGSSAMLPPNGAIPYQNFAQRPMTEEEFYRTQRRFRDVGRGGRHRERSQSPRRYGRKDLYDERRIRRRSRSYERSKSRSRTRQHSPVRRRASPEKVRKYRSPGQSPSRSPSRSQYLPDIRRRTPSKIRRRSPDFSPGRSPSPHNYISERTCIGSSKRSDSPRKPRGRRSITPADPSRSTRLTHQRSPWKARSRSRSPTMVRHPIDEEQSSSKIRQKQDDRKRSSSPSLKRNKHCLPQIRQEAPRTHDREKDLSGSPPRRKRLHSRDHRSHSRESSAFKAERREERMMKEAQRESEKMYTREKFGKADVREQKVDTRKMRADRKEYNYQEVGRPVETERANKSELRKDSFKDQESFDIKKKRRIEEKTDNYSSKDMPKKSDMEAEKGIRSTRTSDGTRSPQHVKSRVSKEVKVTKELLKPDKDPVPNEAPLKVLAKETCKNEKSTVFSRLDFSKRVEKASKNEFPDEKCFDKTGEYNKTRATTRKTNQSKIN